MHGAYLNGRLEGGGVGWAPDRAGRGRDAGWPRGGAVVVLGSAVRITEERVGGEEVLKRDGGGRAVGGVAREAGIGMVSAHQGAVGAPDLFPGRAPRQAEDGGSVVPAVMTTP